MKRTRLSSGGIRGILQDPSVRAVEYQGREFYVVTDVLRELLLRDDADAAWTEIRTRREEIAAATEHLPLTDGTSADCLDLEGILRLSQSVSSDRAERIRWWLAEAGKERLEDSDDPEKALSRARKLYEAQGHDRRWVDKRLRGISARQELTSEWYRRGARTSDDYRELTNDLFKATFGADVESLRAQKGLTHTNEHLRDHMSDLELTITALAETAATALHREHAATDVATLHNDVTLAGEIAARTLKDLEKSLGRPLAQLNTATAAPAA
jgi:hypothetical protein